MRATSGAHQSTSGDGWCARLERRMDRVQTDQLRLGLHVIKADGLRQQQKRRGPTGRAGEGGGGGGGRQGGGGGGRKRVWGRKEREGADCAGVGRLLIT